MPKIEHIVVLMLENRSFDHMLGDLGIDRPGDQYANRLDPQDPQSPAYQPEWIVGDDDVSVDPGHGYLDVMRQLTGTINPESRNLTNKGFVWNYAARLRAKQSSISLAGEIMRCSHRSRVPILATLASEYTVCTRWFCSLPSETWPNRMFAHAAQSDNLVRNVVQLYSHTTTFDVLDEAGVSWSVYAGDIPQTAAYFEPHYLLRDRFNTLAEFEHDVERGRLPHYSFIEPAHFGPWANSQHPTQRVWRGEALIKHVYEKLAANRDIWAKLLFIVTYDEHGGFFDHVPPPSAVPPFEDSRDPDHGFGFDLLGPRVPTVVVSPYASKRAHATVHDHASIVRTVRDAFGIDEPLTARDAAAASVLDVLDGDFRDPVAVPPVAREGEAEAAGDFEVARWAEGVNPDGTIRLNEFQESLVALKRELDGVPTEGAEAVPASSLRSTADVEAMVDDFRARHMTS